MKINPVFAALLLFSCHSTSQEPGEIESVAPDVVRYHVLFVIDLASRRVEIAGITEQPHEAYMKQMARNLTDAVDGFLLKHRYIIMDRDPLFCHSARDMLKNSGVTPVRLPSRSPNLNGALDRLSTPRVSGQGYPVG
ncbi:MAG TPA: hypothetical protein VFN67_10380 [Polyangiales bacterium]|nr:hypothetical protein [Polyangiales bacterium]